MFCGVWSSPSFHKIYTPGVLLRVRGGMWQADVCLIWRWFSVTPGPWAWVGRTVLSVSQHCSQNCSPNTPTCFPGMKIRRGTICMLSAPSFWSHRCVPTNHQEKRKHMIRATCYILYAMTPRTPVSHNALRQGLRSQFSKWRNRFRDTK